MATVNYSWNLPTVGGSEDTWGTSLNANWTDLDTLLGGVSQTEFAILDGATVSTAELNILDGVTATTAELNLLDGITALSGSDTEIVTGTAGTDGQIGKWNADGDLIGVGTNTANGDVVVLEDVGGSPGLPAVDGSQLTNVGGTIKKVAYVQDGAVATGTTLIPYDDTIPQITEGDEYLSLAFTPTSASSVLMIEAVVHGAMSSGAYITAAIFEDGVNDAIVVGNFTSTVTGSAQQTTIVRGFVSAASTSARTYKVRAGGNTAGTFTLNGSVSARRFGGKLISSLKVTEFAT